ncbi:MAG: transposase [Clostridiaceae bacterium]|nr:transposase [Clostridiaceae bacterium]
MFVSKEKRIAKDLLKHQEPSELIDKRVIYQLLYKPIEKIKAISKDQLDEIFKKYPVLSDLLKLLADFKTLLSSRQSSSLSFWIEKANTLELKEISSFITRIQGDYDSVTNAIDYSYNNGLAEGSVNKIKTIKRVMYGRNHFDMLRNKALQLEAMKKDKC